MPSRMLFTLRCWREFHRRAARRRRERHNMHKIVGEANRFKAGLIPEKACKANGRTSSVRVPVRGRGLGYLWHNRAYTAIAARVRPEVRSETKVVMPAMTGPVV